MFLKPVDLTTALRPVLLADETLHVVQDAVGLYQSRDKIPDRQNGHAYLTSHRICYVDSEDPRKRSLAIDLRDVERAEFQAGFLRSSPKITLFQKKVRSRSSISNAAANARSSVPVSATWVCSICSFANPVPSNFSPETANASATPLPPCLACGIKPTFATLLKAAISARSQLLPGASRNWRDASPGVQSLTDGRVGEPQQSLDSATTICPRCTFENHGSIRSCEMCGGSLQPADGHTHSNAPSAAERLELPVFQSTDVLKLSFRCGGDKTFYERLKNALIQRKWLLATAPPVPKPSSESEVTVLERNGSPLAGSKPALRQVSAVGITGLERQRLEARHNNQAVIGDAFEDLETLMASAKQIVALAESFAATNVTGSSASDAAGTQEASAVLSQLGSSVTTKDVLGSGSGSEMLYLSELSRSLAEWLTAPPPSASGSSIINREGGIMALVDVWSLFNRARNGVELVSPTDFRKAADLWSRLKLPVRLRQFRSGVQVVQRSDWSDEVTIKKINEWLDELRMIPPSVSTFEVLSEEDSPDDAAWDWQLYGRGITAQEAAAHFRWSVGVAAEELEMAEEHGVLCREEGIEGLKFWRNLLCDDGS